MPRTNNGQRYEYRCTTDGCDYQGEDYDRKPTEPAGRRVRCPECGEPGLTRVLVHTDND